LAQILPSQVCESLYHWCRLKQNQGASEATAGSPTVYLSELRRVLVDYVCSTVLATSVPAASSARGRTADRGNLFQRCDRIDDELVEGAQQALVAAVAALTPEESSQHAARLGDLIEVELIFNAQLLAAR
jgi:hypothetical protein